MGGHEAALGAQLKILRQRFVCGGNQATAALATAATLHTASMNCVDTLGTGQTDQDVVLATSTSRMAMVTWAAAMATWAAASVGALVAAAAGGLERL